MDRDKWRGRFVLGCLYRSLRSPWPTWSGSAGRWKGWLEAGGAQPIASSGDGHVEAECYNLDNVVSRGNGRVHVDGFNGYGNHGNRRGFSFLFDWSGSDSRHWRRRGSLGAQTGQLFLVALILCLALALLALLLFLLFTLLTLLRLHLAALLVQFVLLLLQPLAVFLCSLLA